MSTIEKTLEAPVTFTESAIKQLLLIQEQEKISADHGLRVGVKGGGCSGLMYQLTFDQNMKEGDQVFEDNGVKVVVDRKSFLYLIGTELEYSGGLNGKGFVFKNPNASRTCGCGESFAV